MWTFSTGGAFCVYPATHSGGEMPEETNEGQEPTTTTTDQESTEATTQSTQSAESTGQEPELKQFSAEYVEELRKEAAQNRIKAKKAEDALKKRQEADMTETEKLQSRLAELEAAQSSWQLERQGLLLKHAVTGEAAKAGAVYPDLIIRSIDPVTVEYDEDGNPTNLAKVVTDLKKNYPVLFRAPNGSADGGRGQDSRTEPNMNDAIRRAAGIRP